MKRISKTGIFVAAVVFCAVLCRMLGNNGILPRTMGLLRPLLYMGLYLGWGVSVSRRILQPQVRRYLVGVALLAVFWFLIRTLKYSFATDPLLIRQLWYWYYFPMLMIPLLAVLVSVSLGKPDHYRLPGWVLLLYLPTVLLLALVLTNDLHQLVFTFPAGAVWSDRDYGYAPGYYPILGWEIACALAAFGRMLAKCRLAQRKKYLPVLLITASVGYGLAYVSGVPWMRVLGGDLAAAQCLMFVGILESCITCGLIQSNTGYEALFLASSLGAQLTDGENNLCLASANARTLTPEQRESARTHPVRADKTTVIKSQPIRFGSVLWQEDVGALTETIEQIQENCLELAEHNRIRRENLETRKKILVLQEKNRASDLLHLETARQMDLIHRLLRQYDGETDDRIRRRLLAGAAVVGAYIKRYGNLLLMSQRAETSDIRDLVRCFEESMMNLELLGVNCLCTLPPELSLKTEEMLRVYRAFETAAEACLFDLRDVWVHARESGERILLAMDFVCTADLTSCASEADAFAREGETWRFTFRLGKGSDGA